MSEGKIHVRMQKYKKIVSIILLAVYLLTGCTAVRPVSGEPGPGAGREAAEGREPFTVCVDAGHGFEDVGTSSSFLGNKTEKDITLSVALYLKDSLEQFGYNVILTHDGVTFPKTAEDDGNKLFNPRERTAYANTLAIDYFVSVHCDSYMADSSVSGTRVYCCQGTSYAKESLNASRHIADAVDEAYPDARSVVVREMSVKEAYYVIRETKMPSTLIELGFVTNPTDASNMLDDTWCRTTAQAIAEGIDRFFTE